MAKGGEYERHVCKLLSAWWSTREEDDVLFWRTAGSGGRATVRSKRGQSTNSAHCGDICALGVTGRELTELIAWELKRGYNHATVHELIDRPDTSAHQTYEAWIAQAVASASNANAPHWAIVHKRDKRDATLTCPADLLSGLIGPKVDFLCPLVRASVTVRTLTAAVDVCCLPFAAFLSRVTPFHVIALHAKHFTRGRT